LWISTPIRVAAAADRHGMNRLVLKRRMNWSLKHGQIRVTVVAVRHEIEMGGWVLRQSLRESLREMACD
jgi:hypothetical protein